jgi:nucleotide-binding universal stress UspA family protein
MSQDEYQFHAAIQDFQSARLRAAVQEVLARVTGKSAQLLSYDDVAGKLKLSARTERGIQQIPLDAIVGSVGRYTDFTRTFLPRRPEDQQRWARVKASLTGPGSVGPDPIEVYKVGEVYFVVDGNHRVSIARQEGQKTIEARVVEFRTDVPLTPDVRVDDLIVKSEYAQFLADTDLPSMRPNVDLAVTTPGQYEILMEQIRVRQYLLQEERGADVPLQEAAADWYDNIYIPLTEAIRDRDLLHWFPGRTLTDLHMWISENRAALENESGWEIQSDVTATDLLAAKNARVKAGKSETGTWRKARTVNRYTDHLFMDILVPLSGEPDSWDAVEQAILMAQRESARLHGLHVMDSKDDPHSPHHLEIQQRFDRECRAAQVDGKLMIEQGEITKIISERATISDLVILKVTHPPRGGLSTLASPFRTIVTNSARPLLAVPGKASRFQRALLAFDGSLLSKEALFVATYLAEMWKTELVVFTTLQGRRGVTTDTQDYVRRYLEVHELEAEYVVGESDLLNGLLTSVDEHRIDLLLMGGYSNSALRGVFIGSTLDHMLRESKVPIFICR